MCSAMQRCNALTSTRNRKWVFTVPFRKCSHSTADCFDSIIILICLCMSSIMSLSADLIWTRTLMHNSGTLTKLCIILVRWQSFTNNLKILCRCTKYYKTILRWCFSAKGLSPLTFVGFRPPVLSRLTMNDCKYIETRSYLDTFSMHFPGAVLYSSLAMFAVSTWKDNRLSTVVDNKLSSVFCLYV